MADVGPGQAAVALPPARDGFADDRRRSCQMVATMDSDHNPTSTTSSVVINHTFQDYEKHALNNGGSHLGITPPRVITECFQVPEKIMRIVIREGGEQISRIQFESGCKIKFTGGSGYMPDRPCTLTGTPEGIGQAKSLLHDIVRYGGGFDDEIDGNSAVQQILIPANKGALVIGKGGETNQLQMVATMDSDQNPTSSISSAVINYTFQDNGRPEHALINGGTYLRIRPPMVITEYFQVPEKMVGVVIGKGGEQISRIESESGCKIQFAKGSGYMPDRPCTLTGTPEGIGQAKRLLHDIVQQCIQYDGGFYYEMDGNGAVQHILIPADKVGMVIGKRGVTIKQLQQISGAEMMMIQNESVPTGTDKPLRIAGDPYKVQQARELVMKVMQHQENFGCGGCSLDVPVPRFAVGIIIGKKGRMIRRIQNDARVKIQFKQDDGLSPERIAMVMGQLYRCYYAGYLITQLVDTAQEMTGAEMMMIQNYTVPTAAYEPLRIAGDPNKVQEARELVKFMQNQGDFRAGVFTLDVPVPRFAVGLIIGKNGGMINKIQNDAGVRIQFNKDDGNSAERIAMVTGQLDRCYYAGYHITQLINIAQERGFFGGLLAQRSPMNYSLPLANGQHEITYAIPAAKCGLVIGRGGETIKNIKQLSRAYVGLQRDPPISTDPNLCIFVIRGTPQQLEKARQLIDEKVNPCRRRHYRSLGLNPFNPNQTTSQHFAQAFMTGICDASFDIWRPLDQQNPSLQNQAPRTGLEYGNAWGQAASPGSQQSPNPRYSPWANYCRQSLTVFSQV